MFALFLSTIRYRILRLFLLLRNKSEAISNLYLKQIRGHQEKVLYKLQKRVNEGLKIRVAFYFNETYYNQNIPVIDAMIKDSFFEVFIVVTPAFIAYSKQFNFNTLQETYLFFKKRFPTISVYLSYDSEKKCFIDFSKKCDLIFYSFVWERTHQFYRINHTMCRDVLHCHTMYCCFLIAKGYAQATLKSRFYDTLWKNYVESNEILEIYKKLQNYKGYNAIVSGYPKFDTIPSIPIQIRTRKKVLLCPHHSIEKTNKVFNAGNILKYAPFFIELIQSHPEIDFVFRPHPLLYSRLASNNIWGEEKTKAYYQQIAELPNCEYIPGGEYMDLFINSDAMILDCMSFIAEYLLTGHPSIFIFQDKENPYNKFSEFGKKIVQNHYAAYEEKDISIFLENVVIQGNDPMIKQREAFVKQHIKVNFPHVSEWIIEDLKRSLTPHNNMFNEHHQTPFPDNDKIPRGLD